MKKSICKVVSTRVMGRHATIIYDTDWQEYQVKLYENGRLLKKATYYTDDIADAKDTARAMLK